MAANVFVYGTLVFPEVMQLVSGCAHEHAPATLAEFARFVLVDRVYPGIVPQAGGATEGRIYFGVDAEGLERLDWYEAEEYDREQVHVDVAGVGGLDAWTYVIAPGHHGIVSRELWDEARFMEEHLPSFLEHVRLDMQAFADEAF